MVTYGPWQEDPNYTQLATYFWDATFDNRFLGDDGGLAEADYGPAGSPRLTTLTDLENSLLVAKAGHGDVPALQLDHGVEYGYGQDHTIIPEEYWSSWGATYQRGRWRIAPSPDGYFYNPPNHGHFDPDAIALQFEGQEPGPTNLSAATTIQGVSLDALTQITTRVGDSTDTSGEAYEDLSGPWETDVVVQPDGSMSQSVVRMISGFVESTEHNSLTTTLGTTIDLTELLSGTGWTGDLWTETAAFVMPRYMPSSGDEVASGEVRYGWMLSRPQVTYTVKPPLYRWVYPSTPYRRISQRGDALAGGARRIHPRPKTIQSSNRRAGGIV